MNPVPQVFAITDPPDPRNLHEKRARFLRQYFYVCLEFDTWVVWSVWVLISFLKYESAALREKAES